MLVLLGAALLIAPVIRAAASSLDTDPAQASLAGWRLAGTYSISTQQQGQGVATVWVPGRSERRYYSGNRSIPAALLSAGWAHVGDPDSSHGFIFDAYQAGSHVGRTYQQPAHSDPKLFRVTTPAGISYDYLHTLAPGEAFNNSFAAVTPDGHWLAAGEWGTMTRLLVFPTPILNSATPRTGGSLPLAAIIVLDHAVRRVQGCTFVTAVRLVCSSDESDTVLWPTPKPLLQINLAHPLTGRTLIGTVRSLGPLPLRSGCGGGVSKYEVEGLDYQRSTGTLRVEVIPPSGCNGQTTVYEYRQAIATIAPRPRTSPTSAIYVLCRIEAARLRRYCVACRSINGGLPSFLMRSRRLRQVGKALGPVFASEASGARDAEVFRIRRPVQASSTPPLRLPGRSHRAWCRSASQRL